MRLLAILIGLTLAPACSLHQVTHDPPPPLPVPDAYSAGTAGAPAPEKWWADFNDTRLDQLIEMTLADNFQIRAAWARVRQGRALVRQASSGKFPQVDASLSTGYQQSRLFFQDMEIVNRANQYSMSAAAAYEVDLWRRLAHTGDAAALDALAFRDDAESIAISLAAEVTEAWFDLISQRAQHALITDQIETNRTYLELVHLRFERGLASALDVFQQRQQLVNTEAQLQLIDSAIRLLEHRLAVLVGKPPRQIMTDSPATLPALPGEVPGTGLPADLLHRRPDVRAARRRVEAADHRVAVAVADRMPALRLSGQAGLQSRTIADLFGSTVFSLLAGVTAPLFDGGRRAAEVERTRAVVEERLMNYGQVLLVAMAEVENALVQEQQQLAYIEQLDEAAELAAATLREAQARYQQGLIDYLPVLNALQGQQRIEITLVQAHRQLLSYRVQLCRALGGTWTQTLSAPEDTNV